MPLIIVVMTATLLVGGAPSAEKNKRIAAGLQSKSPTWPWLVGHALTYLTALGITIFVFNRNLEFSHPWLWIYVWAWSAVASLFLLIAAVIPRSAIAPLAKPALRALASGVPVGALALLGGYVTSFLWRPLSRITLEVVEFVLSITGHQVVEVPEKLIVGTPACKVFINRQCSGYEGTGLIAVLLGFYLVASRRSLRFPNTFLLLPAGMILVWLGNGLRIAALIAVSTWVSPEIANGGFHSAAGWLLFCAITLGLVAASRHSRWFAREMEGRGTLMTPDGAYLLPLLFLIATALITSLFTADFDYLYPLRVLTPPIPLWLFRSDYKDFTWSWSWVTVGLAIVAFVIWVALEPSPDPATAALIPQTYRRCRRSLPR